jgi:hypothetical protein
VHETTVKTRVRAAEELRGHTADERVAETLVGPDQLLFTGTRAR